ncbi:MAG: DUF58 domain-containing protein [Myxococcota bacterium]
MSAPATETTGRERRPALWVRWFGVPTGALVAWSVAPLALSLGVIASRAVLIPVVAIDVVLVLVALADLATIARGIAASRVFAPVQAVGRAFDVVVRVRNVGRRQLRARFTDDPPGEADGLPAEATLAPGEAFDATYRLVVRRRGQHPFGDLTVRLRSVLGLWERQLRFEVPGSVRMYPDFAQLRETGLRGRLSEVRAPVRARRRPGGENEFQRLRPYVAGDPYRHIDWKATARKRDFVSREYGQESNQNLIFLLDAGRMMSARSGSLTAFDHALNAAVLLGQVALNHGDRVGLLAFDREIRAWLPPRGGARSSNRLIRATYDLEPTLHEPDYALAFRHLTQHVKRRSLVVVLTAVVDEVNGDLAQALIRALGSRHLAVSTWIRDVDVDALVTGAAADDRARYVRAAAAEFVGWREAALASLRQRGALVLDVPPSGLTTGLLHRYLEIKARRLL